MEVLENVGSFLNERTYLKQKHYFKEEFEYKIYKTKPITKEQSYVKVRTMFIR